MAVAINNKDTINTRRMIYSNMPYSEGDNATHNNQIYIKINHILHEMYNMEMKQNSEKKTREEAEKREKVS